MHPGVLTVDGGRNRHAVEYGRLTVPENRERDDSRWIELAFARFRARTERPGPPIVFLAGGPGASGIRVAQRIPGLFLELSKVADVIALDQRGVGLSRPCLDSSERWDLPLDDPVDRDRFIDVAVQRARALRTFWEERGTDLAGYTSTQSADDVDDLRRALGVERVSLYGLSYGSHLGLAILRRHESRVHRAVLGLVEGPDDTHKLPANTERHFAHINELARQAAGTSDRADDLLTLMQETREALHREPRVVPAPIDGSGNEARDVVLGAFDYQLYLSEALGSIRMIRALPRIFDEFRSGNFGAIAVDARERRQAFLPSAMSLVMDAASGVSPERQELIREQAPDALLGDVFNLPFPYVAEALGAPDLGPDYRSPVRAATPTLLLSGSLDGRTPASNAEAVLAHFRQGQHVIVEGASHSYFPELDETARRFLGGEDETYPARRVPFEFDRAVPSPRTGKV